MVLRRAYIATQRQIHGSPYLAMSLSVSLSLCGGVVAASSAGSVASTEQVPSGSTVAVGAQSLLSS